MPLVGHNLKFDSLWLKVHYGVDWRADFDTMLAHHILDENARHGLDYIARVYLAAPDWDIPLAEKQGGAPYPKIAKYHAHDVYYTRNLYFVLKKLLAEDKLIKRLFDNLVMPAANLYVEMEARGCYVDLDKMDEVEDYLTTEIGKAERRLKKWGDINWASPKQVATLLYGKLKVKSPMKTKKGADSTAESALKMIDHDCVADLLTYRGHKQQLSFFIEGWRHFITKNRIHPSFKLHGTVCFTGDTLVLTDRGYIPCLEVKVGDQVLSHSGQPRRIQKIINNGVKECIRVRVGQRSINCTPNHPFLTKQGWVEAKNLTIGQDVKVLGGAEQWRYLPNWPYEISSWGRVRNAIDKNIRIQQKRKTGHLKVTLKNGKKSIRRGKDFKVHKLVNQVFGSNPHGPETRHKNGIAWVNVKENLTWGTRVDNANDMIIHGKGPVGKENQRKLTKNQIVAIRKDGRTHQMIADEYGVHRRLIGMIKANKRRVAEFRRPLSLDFIYQWASVTKIEKIGKQQTYGLQIETDHSHVTNGIVTHNTGRPSCEHPNFQQVPRDPRIRSLITSPPGWELLEGDLSQIELRIVAELSRCPSMMQAFLTGVDIHWKTALGELERYVGQKDLVLKTASAAKKRKITSYAEAIDILREIGPDAAIEINPIWKEMRKKAKAVGFGYVYGMWWKKFLIYARDNYDMKLTPQEAQQSRIAYFQMYPLEGWHNSQRKFAHKNGYVRSLSGRKRRLPQAQSREDSPARGEAFRQAINSPVQGFASDINIMVLLQLRQEFPRTVVRPVITVHDSILIEVRKDYVERVTKRIEEIMRGPDLFKVFNIDLSVPIEGEVKIGPWGSGVSLKKWREQNENQKIRQ